MGRLADRFGIVVAGDGSALSRSCVGFVAAGFAPSLWPFALAHGC